MVPLSDRDYIRGSHPPTCTCAECTARRLREFQEKNIEKRVSPFRRDSAKKHFGHRNFIKSCGLVLWRLCRLALARVIGIIKLVVRVFLIAISLCSGVLGAHGLYVYIFKTDVIGGSNTDKIFLHWNITNVTISRIIEEVTIHSVESIVLPIVLIAVGILTWITQSSMAKRSLYRRVRFSSPTQASPIAWFLVVAGIVVTVYVIANWESMDQGIATLVIIANVIAILWNLRIVGH